MKAMDSLRSILPKVLSKRGLKTQVEASHAVLLAQQWLERALPSLKGELTVKKLSHATLSIECNHSIASQECQQLLPFLLEYLQRETKNLSVTDIRLVRG